MRTVAAEVTAELDRERQSRRRLVQGDPPTRDNLLVRQTLRQDARPATTRQRQHKPSPRRSPPRSRPATTSSRAPPPSRRQTPSSRKPVARFAASDAIARPLPQESFRSSSRVRQDFSFPVEARTTVRRSLPSSSSISERDLLQRLGPDRRPRFGVSSHACLFKLCELGEKKSSRGNRFFPSSDFV